MDVQQKQNLLAQQAAIFQQAAAYSQMIGAQARGLPVDPAALAGMMGGPPALSGAGIGLTPEANFSNVMGAGVAGLAGAGILGGMAALSWGSMSAGMQRMGSMPRMAVGIMDPMTMMGHGLFRGMQRSITRAGLVLPERTMKATWHGTKQLFQMGEFGAIGGGLMRGAAYGAGLAAIPIGIGAAAAWGVRQMGAGAAGWSQTTGLLGEVMPHTGITSEYGSRDVGLMNRAIGQFTAGAMDPGRARQDIMGLVRSAAVGGEFRGTRSMQEFRQKFGKLVQETKEVSALLRTSLSEAYSMMQSMGGLGYTTGAQQGQALGRMAFGGRGAGISTQGLMTAASAGMQLAPAMGMSRVAGAEMGRQMAAGLGYSMLRNPALERRIFEQTGLRGEQAAVQMSSQFNQSIAGLGGNPLVQAVMAAAVTPAGKLEPWRLQRIMSGQMSTQDIGRMAQKAMKDPNLANMVQTRGPQLLGQALQTMGVEGFTAGMSRIGGKALGVGPESALQQMTGMDPGMFRDMLGQFQGRRANEANAIGVGMVQTGLSMRNEALGQIIDPKRILQRAWRGVIGPVERSLQEVGAKLMQRVTGYVEKRTSALISNLVSHVSPEWNRELSSVWSGRGTTGFFAGMSGLAKSAGLGGGGMMELSDFRGGLPAGLPGGFSNDVFAPTLQMGAGGPTGLQLPALTETRDFGVGLIAGEQRGQLGFMQRGAGEDFYRGRGGINAALFHPAGSQFARLGLNQVAGGAVGLAARGLGSLHAAGLKGLARGGSAFARGGWSRGTRMLAGGLDIVGGGAAGLGAMAARGLRIGSRTLGPAAWVISGGLTAWDTYQDWQNTEAWRAAEEQQGSYYGGLQMMLGGSKGTAPWLPTGPLAGALGGKAMWRPEAGIGRAAGVAASSFLGGFLEPFRPGITERMRQGLGVESGRAGLQRIDLPGGPSMYAFGHRARVAQLKRLVRSGMSMSEAMEEATVGGETGNIALSASSKPIVTRQPKGTFGILPGEEYERWQKWAVLNAANRPVTMIQQAALHGRRVPGQAALWDYPKAAGNLAAWSTGMESLKTMAPNLTKAQLAELSRGEISEGLEATLAALPEVGQVFSEFARGGGAGTVRSKLPGKLPRVRAAAGAAVPGLGRPDTSDLIRRHALIKLGDVLGGAQYQAWAADPALALRRMDVQLAGLPNEVYDLTARKEALARYTEALAMNKAPLKEDALIIKSINAGLKQSEFARGYAGAQAGVEGKAFRETLFAHAMEVKTGLNRDQLQLRAAAFSNRALRSNMQTLIASYQGVGKESDITQGFLNQQNAARQGIQQALAGADIGQLMLFNQLVGATPELAGLVPTGEAALGAYQLGTTAKRKKWDYKKRLEGMESFLGVSFGLTTVEQRGLRLGGVGPSAEESIETALMGRYKGVGPEKLKGLVQGVTSFLTGKGDYREVMGRVGKEVATLSDADAPQLTETKANTTALAQLTSMLSDNGPLPTRMQGMISQLQTLSDNLANIQLPNANGGGGGGISFNFGAPAPTTAAGPGAKMVAAAGLPR